MAEVLILDPEKVKLKKAKVVSITVEQGENGPYGVVTVRQNGRERTARWYGNRNQLGGDRQSYERHIAWVGESFAFLPFDQEKGTFIENSEMLGVYSFPEHRLGAIDPAWKVAVARRRASPRMGEVPTAEK